MGNHIEIDSDGFQRLKSAVLEAARNEAARISQLVIDDMRSRSPIGIFDDVAARHMWDEYCWALQEGPFDVNLDFEDVRIGSLSDAWEDTMRLTVMAELDKLPKHTMIIMSALAFDKSEDDEDDDGGLGYIYMDSVCKLVAELVNESASRRNLDLIGPDRAFSIGYHIEGSGMVWRLLDDPMDVISGYADEMINSDGDLSKVSQEMADQFMVVLGEDTENPALAELLDRFAGDIRAMVLQKDILPSLEDMRVSLIEILEN